jgi:hypothetical protein
MHDSIRGAARTVLNTYSVSRFRSFEERLRVVARALTPLHGHFALIAHHILPGIARA